MTAGSLSQFSGALLVPFDWQSGRVHLLRFAFKRKPGALAPVRMRSVRP